MKKIVFTFFITLSFFAFAQTGLHPLPVPKNGKMDPAGSQYDIYEHTDCDSAKCGPYAANEDLISVKQAFIQGERLNLGHVVLPDPKTVNSIRLIRTATSPKKARFDFFYFQEVCKNFEYMDQKKKDFSFQCVQKGSEKVFAHVDIDFSALPSLKDDSEDVYELRTQLVKQKLQIQLFRGEKEVPASFGLISQIKKMFTEVDETFQPQP